MRKLRAALQDVGFGLATAYLLVLGALAFKLILTRPVPGVLSLNWMTTRGGIAALYLGASLAVLLGLYFFLRLWDNMTKRRRFCREGEVGPIEVSPFAIKDFIQALLSQEQALDDSHVVLNHAADGTLDVVLTIALKLDAAVVETAERLQNLLKTEIEGRLGVQVNRITVYAERIGSYSRSSEPAMEEHDER